MADQIVSDLEDLFPDTVLVAPPGTPDGFGAETPGAYVSYVAFVVGKVAQILAEDGTMRKSSVRAVFAGAFGLTVRHKYLLPVRFVPRAPLPLSVGSSTDENGPHHETVYFE